MASRLESTTKERMVGMPAIAPIERGDAGLRIARALSGLDAILLGGAAAAGLFVDHLYRDPPSVAAMFRAYDLIALAIIGPSIAVTLLPRFRRSPRARLVWTGLLAYCVYHSAMYVFGTVFNALFLVHVAVFSLSIAAFGLALANLDMAGIASRFDERTPARLVAGCLLFLGMTLAAFWSVPALGFALTGDLPEEGSRLIVPLGITHLGWALDLSLLVPAYAVAGVLLWRRVPSGFVLATVVLIAGVLQQVGYMTALVFQSKAGIPDASAFDPIEPFITAVYVGGALMMLTRIRRLRE